MGGFKFTTSLCGFLLLLAANASACTLSQVQINPIEPGRIDIFVGKTESLEVQFKNEKKEGTVEVFPEPPLTVISHKFSTRCSIDGGVWVRKSVFVSDNSNVLVTQEFSGSQDFLNFYDVQTCKKLNEIDISNSIWSIQGSKISVRGENDADRKVDTAVRVYSLDATCNLSTSCK